MIRVCPKRDAICPHGSICPYAIDQYSCRDEPPMTDTTLAQRLRDTAEERSKATASEKDGYMNVVAKISRSDGLLMADATDRIEADAATIASLRDANKALTAGETAYKAMLAQAEDDFRKAEAKLAKVRAEHAELTKMYLRQGGSAFTLWRDEKKVTTRLSAELAEARIKLELAASALDEASEEVGDWGAYAGDYFQNKHDLEGCVKEIAQQAFSIRAFLASKEASQ